MIQAKLWFRCAALHDPVSPVIVRPAILGWEGKERSIELTIPKTFTGEELVGHMQGWFTVDVRKAIVVIQQFGNLKIKDSHELIVEIQDDLTYDRLTAALTENFQDQLSLEKLGISY
jgi:hypothetical protein